MYSSVINLEWGKWGEWSECDKTCGGGEQRRERSCKNETDDKKCVGTDSETRKCNEEECKGFFQLQFLSLRQK